MSGNTSTNALLTERITTTARSSTSRFCWCGRLRSIVTNTSNSALAARRSFPLLNPSQPHSWTVSTSRSASKSGLIRRSTFSSRSTRRAVASGMVLGFAQRKFEIGLGLLASYSRKAVEEAVERLARLEVVDQRLDGDARALEEERAADEVGTWGNDLFEGHDLDEIGRAHV